ncbi:MAG: GLPGLI family protein [Bacteroidales bacterium]|nr:GLPGLI family protein [Bacteroidales bacterium]MDY6002692.1 GLPGLI family protein [Candidatus Cryptobacteroides sp.]
MRKILSIFLLLFFVTSIALAQDVAHARNLKEKMPFDDLNIRFTYRASYRGDTCRTQRYFDNEALDVGAKYIRFYSLFSETIDSTSYAYENGLKKSRGNGYDPKEKLSNLESGQYEEIFFGYPQSGTMTVHDRFYKKSYMYSEPMPHFSWSYVDSTMTILGYECHKAVTKFRGREWTAWYTFSIPLPYGPWKLGGLPGLILKAHDDKGYFTYDLIGVHKAEAGEKIYRYDSQYIKCTRDDVRKMNNLRWQDPAMLASGNGCQVVNYAIIDKTHNPPKVRRVSFREAFGDKYYIPQRELE